MVKVRPLVITFLLFALVIVGMLNAYFMIAQQNNPSQSIANDPTLSNYSEDLNAALGNNYNETSESYSAFSNSSVTTSNSLPLINTIAGVWKTLVRTPIILYNLTINVALQYLFGPDMATIIGYVFGAIIFLSIIIAIVYLVTRGEGG